MKNTLVLILLALVAVASASAQYQPSGPQPEMIGLMSSAPQTPTNLSGAVIGAGGTTTFYYWVVAVYGGGSVMSSGPIKITNVAVPTAGGNYVRINWTGVRGVGVTYDVLKTTTPSFNGPVTCAGCLLATGVTVTTALDNAGAAPGPYTLAQFLYPNAQASISIDNRDSVKPALNFTTPAQGVVVSGTQLNVTGPNGAYLNQSAVNDATIYGMRTRISSNFLNGTTTLAVGGQFDTQSLTGATPGNQIGVRGTVNTATGTVGNDILYGVQGLANGSIGIIGGASGVRGDMIISGTATAGVDAIMVGVKGDFDDALGLSAATNVTAGVMGYIADRNVVGPDGAIVAMLAGGGVRQAAQSPSSAFRVVDHNTTANVGFNYGFDAYYTEGGFVTTLNNAVLRGDLASVLQNETALKWRSDSEIQVSDLALAALDWSARTGSVQGVGSRISANFATVTGLKGADFRATSTGGASGTLIGVQTSTTMAAGTVTLDELYGANFNANATIGTATNAYGAVGTLNIAATMTNVTQFAIGVLGNYDDAKGVNVATNYTAAVMGVIQDKNTPGPDGAVVALLNGDSVRTAGNNPVAAFKVIDRTTTGGVGFQYGLDMYWRNAPEATHFEIADIRGEMGERLNNATVGVWSITRGSGNLTGLQLEAVTHANLAGWAAANGTMAYCSNCDPAIAGAGPTACTTGGTSTGAMAFRLNAAWTCVGI